MGRIASNRLPLPMVGSGRVRRVRREHFAGGGSPAIFARRRRRAAQFCSAAAASEICRRRRRSAALVWRYSGQVIAVNVKISAHVVYI